MFTHKLAENRPEKPRKRPFGLTVMCAQNSSLLYFGCGLAFQAALQTSVAIKAVVQPQDHGYGGCMG